MIEIEINQDIRDYKTKLIGPFTTRQVICIILGGVTVVGAYNLLQPYLTSDTATFICMILASPFVLMSGIFEPHGMKMEDFLRASFVSLVLSPTVRKYELENSYNKQLMEERKKKKKKKRKKSKIKAYK
ncbi:PrgI family protein [Anaerostipes hadrus]|uniref:PrgI family protein n=1 Tax=Anaerostipes hadrus TaxID=649756 RepID=A0A174JMH4_ANAHA|nr:PrgI family protein [Anaerostipes hadrus]CUO99027.1 PrgI family protein [Anaerostipes hadrus]